MKKTFSVFIPIIILTLLLSIVSAFNFNQYFNNTFVYSFLGDNLQIHIAKIYYYPIIIICCGVIIIHYLLHLKIFNSLRYFLISLLFFNLLGLLVYKMGYNWSFFETNFIILFSTIYVICKNIWEKERKSRLLKKASTKYIDPNVISGIFEKPELLQLGGIRKNITVLFSDIRGFTSLSEKTPPDELIKFLNEYFEEMCQVISEHNGTIDKFMGDGIMAFWNAPHEDKYHQINAVKAAIKMSEKIKLFDQRYGQFANLKVGIGINTGEMVVGNMGSKTKFDYTVIGDNVNLASRVEGLTKKYGVNILVTESVLKNPIFNKYKIVSRKLDEVLVKGKETPVTIFEIDKANSDTTMKKQIYEEGFNMYQQGRIDIASNLFKKLEKIDTASHIMLQRIEEYYQTKHLEKVYGWNEK